MQLHHQEDETAANIASVQLKNHKLALTCICLDSKDKFAFTGSKDGSIIKWSLQTRKIEAKINSISKKTSEQNSSKEKQRHRRHINCIAISTDDKFLATGGWDKHIRIWSPIDLSWIHTFTLHRQEVTCLAFRQNHHMLYSGSADKSIMLWTLEDDDNRCYVESLYGHESPITSLDALKKERVISSGGRDQSIRVWKIMEQAQTVFDSKHESVDVVRYIDDNTFISGGEDGAITVWSTMKRSPVFSIPNAHPGEGTDSSRKNWISALATLSLRDTKQTKGTKRQKLDDGDINTGDDDDEEEEDNSDEEEEEGEGEAGTEVVEKLECRGDPIALIASGSCNLQIKVWRLFKTGSKYELKLHQTLECPGFVNDLRFTKSGDRLVAACGQEHKFGRWWKLKSPNCMRILEINK